MGTIDFDKFLLSFIEKAKEYHPITAFNIPSCIKKALNDQGLQYKDGTFVKTQRNIAAEAKENGYGKSEDEKMRKRLMAMCQHYIDCYAFDQYNLVGYKEALAWLEKQGEKESNKVPIWKHWKDGIAGNGEGEPIYLVKICNTYSLNSCLGFECDYIELSELDNLMLEKQGEQNPYSGVSISHDNGVDILFDKKLVKHISGEKQSEQKPYGQREECLDCQFNYAGECKGSCAMKRSERKLTEWNEEDETNLRRAIRATQVVYPVAADWLKFLKDRVQPQNTWKPSKEQIIALRWVLNNIPYNKHKEEISGLLDQIIKL